MPETFDFGDGLGPVPAHRHPNGGGWVADTSIVAKTAYVGPEARVYGNACVGPRASILNSAQVYDNANVYMDAVVGDNVQIFEEASVYGGAVVGENAVVSGEAKVHSLARIMGSAKVSGKANISCDAVISGEVVISGDAKIASLAQIQSSKDFISSPMGVVYRGLGGCVYLPRKHESFFMEELIEAALEMESETTKELRQEAV